MPILGFTASEIASRCKGAHKVADGSWRAQCPGHNGKHDSFTIRDVTDGVSVECHSKACSWNTILIGLGIDTRYSSNGTVSHAPPTEVIYPYHDANGELVYQVVRTVKNGEKSFYQRQPNPDKPGDFVYDKNGVERVLYRLPQLIKAITARQTILIVEGEKDVHTAEGLGFTATTKAGGAGNWDESYSEALRGANVVIIPDNDDPGRKYAQEVIKAISDVAASAKRLDLPGVPPKGDLTDWVKSGGTFSQLEELISLAPLLSGFPPGIIESLKGLFTSRVEVQKAMVKDLLYPGGVTTIAAPSGVGKSVTAHIIAREVASGGVIRGQRIDKARVLLIDTDNPRGLVSTRLKSVCDDDDVSLDIITREKTKPLSDKVFWPTLPLQNYDLVILDSFGGATPGVSETEGAKTQEAMAVLKAMADRGPAVLVLDNTTKSAEQYRGRGEKLERIDVAYECRDVTNWTPTRAQWWLSLPEAGDNAWQERASRRKSTQKIRLAFIARKFRWGEEPEPFVLEVSFDTTPWSFTDITQQIEKQAGDAVNQEKNAHAAEQFKAVLALELEVQRRDEANEEVIGKRDAQDLMYENSSGVTHREILRLIDAHDANIFPTDGKWRVCDISGARGNKKGIYPKNSNAEI